MIKNYLRGWKRIPPRISLHCGLEMKRRGKMSKNRGGELEIERRIERTNGDQDDGGLEKEKREK